jgi:hypothetical protein
VLLSLLVWTLTAAGGDARVVIVERSTLGISADAGARLRGRLGTALERASVPAKLLPTKCGDRACLTALAKELGTCVVGVTLVKNRKGLAVDVEAVDAQAVLVQESFLLSSDTLEDSPEAQVFAHHLAGKLERDRPVAERPPSVAPAPEPVTMDARPELTEAPPSALAPKVIFGASAGVAAVGIGLLIAGAVVKGQLDGALAEQPVVTTLTRAEAEQQAALANGLLGAGAAALGVGVAGSITALVMVFSEPDEPYR